MRRGIRETVDDTAWHSWDRRRRGVAFVGPTPSQRGIRETVDDAAWHSRDRRRYGVAFARPSTLGECHSRDRQHSAPDIFSILFKV